jgi:hypothetical protein
MYEWLCTILFEVIFHFLKAEWFFVGIHLERNLLNHFIIIVKPFKTYNFKSSKPGIGGLKITNEGVNHHSVLFHEIKFYLMKDFSFVHF